jgi:hypothetical protein
MSLLPYIQDEPGDLCWECGREGGECICGVSLPEDFDPLGEDSYDPDWDDYKNDLDESWEDYKLGEPDEQDTSTTGKQSDLGEGRGPRDQ